jgi:DNA repair exonuclease SbcCD ATPase subunit
MGHNGSGKTTILEALTFALTGKEPDNTKRAEWASSMVDSPFEASVTATLLDQTGK